MTNPDKSDARLGCIVTFLAVTIAIGIASLQFVPPSIAHQPIELPPAVETDALPPLVIEGETKTERLQSYWRQGNTNAVNHRLGEPWIERDVSSTLRRRIMTRDGNKCLACGSIDDLNCDHTRALQNGGGNESENLGMLFHECHVDKGRLDNSVRRQRKKVGGR